MDFAIPDATRALLDRARAIIDEDVIPIEASVARRGFLAAEPELLEVRKKVKSAGMWAPQMARDVGGMGLSLLDHGMLSEVLGRSPYGHFAFGCQAPDAGNMEILHRHATPEQREAYFQPLVTGEIRSCFSMTEPDTPGSNPTQLACSAVKDGDDYIINGRKWFTSSADGAAFAIVMVVTDPNAPRHQRASQVIVPTDNPGFRLIRNIPVMGHIGEGYESHAEIEYVDCRIPQSNRLGEEGAGFQIAQERLGPGRIHHCMRWIGICERAFDLMCERAVARKIDGDKPLASKQIIQSWIAECRARINAARWMVLQAAWTIDNRGLDSAREEISLIKFFVADVMMHVVDRAIQVHGALGLTDDTILAYFYRHERAARIYDGPDEVHKIAVAKRILRRYSDGPR